MWLIFDKDTVVVNTGDSFEPLVVGGVGFASVILIVIAVKLRNK